MKRIIVYVATVVFLITMTIAVILYGKGYNFNFGDGKIGISGTGLLAATSQPDGAGIYINNHLTSATNNSINLPPGEYDVKISKAGYSPWNKKIKSEKEVVSSAYALLIPTAPKLNNVTQMGVSNPVLDPTRTKIAYTVSSLDDPRKNGIYILDMGLRPILTLQSSSSQIVDNTIDNFSKAKLSWSPDAKEIAATISAEPNIATTYLLKTTFNENPHDIKEDKNFKTMNSNVSSLNWLADSKHLIYVADKKIQIMDYDGQNRTTIYAGPFIDDYVFSWPDSSKLLILTDLGNSNTSPNLYTIGLK